jgi:hypothetical protein
MILSQRMKSSMICILNSFLLYLKHLIIKIIYDSRIYCFKLFCEVTNLFFKRYLKILIASLITLKNNNLAQNKYFLQKMI